MIDSTFIERLVELTEAAEQRQEIDGRTFLTRGHWEEIRDPMVDPIYFEAISAFACFVEEGNFDPSDAMAVVSGHDTVELYGAIRPDQKRPVFAKSSYSYSLPSILCGSQVRLEDALVQVQAGCEPSDDLQKFVQLLASVDSESTVTWDDDGLATKVTVKDGVSVRREAPFPRYVTLRPYCSWGVIEQPDQQFIPRLKKGGGGEPFLSLSNVESARWKEEACERLRDYLRGRVSRVPVIG